MAENSNLTAKQQALILAMAQGLSIPDAAQRCQVAERTAYNWMKLPQVKSALELARQEAFNEALHVLRTGVKASLVTLARNMGEKSPPGIQVRAAQIWLEQAITVHKLSEVERGLAELKALLEESERRWR